MLLFKVSIISLFALISFIFCEHVAPKLESLERCEVVKDDIQKDFEMKLDLKDGAVSGYIDIPFAIDDSIDYEASAEKMVDGKWVDAEFNLQGSFCDGFQMYMPKVADKLVRIMNLKELCPIPAGRHELGNFTIEQDEIDMHVDPGFHFKVHVIYKKDDKPVTCLNYELKY